MSLLTQSIMDHSALSSTGSMPTCHMVDSFYLFIDEVCKPNSTNNNYHEFGVQLNVDDLSKVTSEIHALLSWSFYSHSLTKKTEENTDTTDTLYEL